MISDYVLPPIKPYFQNDFKILDTHQLNYFYLLMKKRLLLASESVNLRDQSYLLRVYEHNFREVKIHMRSRGIKL